MVFLAMMLLQLALHKEMIVGYVEIARTECSDFLRNNFLLRVCAHAKKNWQQWVLIGFLIVYVAFFVSPDERLILSAAEVFQFEAIR